jgi:hypothetical protein
VGLNYRVQTKDYGSRMQLKHAPGLFDELGPKQLHLTPDSTREQVPSPHIGRLSASAEKTREPGEGTVV